ASVQGPRLDQHVWIVDGCLPCQRIAIAVHALDDVHILAMEITGDVEPAGVVEPDRIYDQRVSFPMADRLAFPRAVQIIERSMRPAIGHDHPVSITPALSCGTN